MIRMGEMISYNANVPANESKNQSGNRSMKNGCTESEGCKFMGSERDAWDRVESIDDGGERWYALSYISECGDADTVAAFSPSLRHKYDVLHPQ